jgi:hypothetical protein
MIVYGMIISQRYDFVKDYNINKFDDDLFFLSGGLNYLKDFVIN